VAELLDIELINVPRSAERAWVSLELTVCIFLLFISSSAFALLRLQPSNLLVFAGGNWLSPLKESMSLRSRRIRSRRMQRAQFAESQDAVLLVCLGA